MTDTIDTPDTDTTDSEQEAPSYDPLAALTLAEIDAGSRLLKASLVHAVTEQTVDYSKALAITLWLHRRRQERGAQLTDCMALTYEQLSEQLGALGPAAAESDPTASGRG